MAAVIWSERMATTKTDIRGIEKSIGHKLPKDYQTILLDYPEQLATMRNAGVPVAKMELLASAKHIISANEFVRSKQFGYTDSKGRPKQWPSHYLVIGDDGLGDQFVLNTETGRVLVFCHEIGIFQNYARNMRRFIFRLFEQIALMSTSSLPDD
jgi:hypothetical protein